MSDQILLRDGYALPPVGFGTYPLEGEECYQAVTSALANGYRLIDSAISYGNEAEVGQAVSDHIAQQGLPREEVTIQTKIPGRDHEFKRAITAAHASIKKLGVERLDVLLIHWPNPRVGLYQEAWQALIELQRRGDVRTIGVSNFPAQILQEIIAASGVVPAINQIELHPWFAQSELRQLHRELSIATQAWSPLGKRNAPFDEPPVVAAATRLGVSPAQVILRWHVQLGNIPLPKSARSDRQRQNLDIFDFELTNAEVAAISALSHEGGRLFDGDPLVYEEL